MPPADESLRDLRDESAVLDWLAAGVACVRETPAVPARMTLWLDVLVTMVGSGEPVPAFGILADITSIAIGDVATLARRAAVDSNPLPATLVRRYDDHVLGRLHVDAAFQRGAAAICRYQQADRVRALAYLIQQLQRQTGVQGVHLSPGILRGLAGRNRARFVEELATRPLPSSIVDTFVPEFDAVCRGFRQAANLLSPEDLFELEHGTAVKSFGQRLALRQTLEATRRLAAALPSQPPRVHSRWRDVPTPISEEDQYPVGGYTSLSTRGSIESLLHSQLAYMERDERPDLFDIKFLRDELLYYSRDDNQFLRPRRTTFLVLHPSLAETRIKDSALPFQRIILTLGLLTAAVQTWMAWLTTDSLHFEIIFLDNGPRSPLRLEAELLETIFRSERDLDVVRVRRLASKDLDAFCEQTARLARCHAVVFSAEPAELKLERVPIDTVLIAGPIPEVTSSEDGLATTAGETEPLSAPIEGWQRCLGELVVRGL
jgi:hypothetical protein